MKNPTEPNFKTERYPIFIVAVSILAAFYFRVEFAYIWPIMLAFAYSMFLFFPYFKINHQESAALKEQWHKAKELSLSFLFALQVVGGILLSGPNDSLIWALPILFFLFIVSLIPTVIRVFKYRKVNPMVRPKINWGKIYGK
jgi:hypothetical protein